MNLEKRENKRDCKKALLLWPRRYCGRDVLILRRRSAAAAARRTSCRTSQNFAAIGALLCDPKIKVEVNVVFLFFDIISQPLVVTLSFSPFITSQ